MFKLDLEKAEEPEIKLPTSAWSAKKSKRVPEKHLFLLYWLCQSLWLCGSQQTVENSSRDGNTRPPDLPLEKSVCRSGSNCPVRTGHGTTDWFQIGKGVQQGCILSPCLFNLYAEYVMRNAGLDEAQAGIKIAGRNINNLICKWHHPYGRKQRRTKEPLDESERGEWKSWLKAQHSENEDHGIRSHHFMANRWRNSGNSGRLYFEGLQNQYRWWRQPWN